MVQNEGAFYKLINGEYDNRESQGRIIDKEFHACSIDESCTDVVKYKASGIYQKIYGEGMIEKLHADDLAWKKVHIVEMNKSREFFFWEYLKIACFPNIFRGENHPKNLVHLMKKVLKILRISKNLGNLTKLQKILEIPKKILKIF